MKYERYLNGVLVESYDHRTVADTAQAQINAIKEYCKVAIEQTGISWMTERELSGGKVIPQEIKDKCQFYRTLSNTLEQQIQDLVSTAVDNNDKAVCDKIEQIIWTI